MRFRDPEGEVKDRQAEVSDALRPLRNHQNPASILSHVELRVMGNDSTVSWRPGGTKSRPPQEKPPRKSRWMDRFIRAEDPLGSPAAIAKADLANRRFQLGETLPLRTVTTLGALALSLLTVEAVLRLLGVGYPLFDQADALLGNSLIPHAEGRQSREGESFVRINSFGFRDRERHGEKPIETLRIAVLGDSFTEARQVDLEDTFCAVIEKQLMKHSALARNIEVLNFGVSGHGTFQQLLNLRHRVWRFDPDVVLLAFYTGNDVSDNSRILKGASSLPYHYYQGAELRLDGSFARSESFQLRNGRLMRWTRLAIQHSRLLQLLNHARLMNKLAALRESGQQAGFAGPGEPGMRREVYVPPRDPVWEDAWRVTEGLLAEMHDEARSRGVPFLVVTLSSGIQVHPDPMRRSRFLQEAATDDLFYPDRRIASLGIREGFPVLLLAPGFQKYAETNGVFLHGFEPQLGFGHWNREGHSLAGERIARWLAAELAGSLPLRAETKLE